MVWLPFKDTEHWRLQKKEPPSQRPTHCCGFQRYIKTQIPTNCKCVTAFGAKILADVTKLRRGLWFGL